MLMGLAPCREGRKVTRVCISHGRAEVVTRDCAAIMPLEVKVHAPPV